MTAAVAVTLRHVWAYFWNHHQGKSPSQSRSQTYIGALALGHMAHGVVPLTRTHHIEQHGLLVGARTLGKPPKM